MKPATTSPAKRVCTVANEPHSGPVRRQVGEGQRQAGLQAGDAVTRQFLIGQVGQELAQEHQRQQEGEVGQTAGEEGRHDSVGEAGSGGRPGRPGRSCSAGRGCRCSQRTSQRRRPASPPENRAPVLPPAASRIMRTSLVLERRELTSMSRVPVATGSRATSSPARPRRKLGRRAFWDVVTVWRSCSTRRKTV